MSGAKHKNLNHIIPSKQKNIYAEKKSFIFIDLCKNVNSAYANFRKMNLLFFFLTNISVVFFQKCKCMHLLCKVDANYFYFVFFISKVKQRYNHQVFKIYAQKIFHFISKVIQRFKHHLCNDYAKKSFVCLSFQLFSFIRILVYNRYFWFYSKSYVMICYHPKFMQREKILIVFLFYTRFFATMWFPSNANLMQRCDFYWCKLYAKMWFLIIQTLCKAVILYLCKHYAKMWH